MGLILWLAAGLFSYALTRFIETWRRSWVVELGTGLGCALLAGFVATAMDFGGWAVADGRAFAFCGLSSLLAIGLVRLRARTTHS